MGFPPAGYEVGKSYLVPSAAWHETNNEPSMMAAMLYKSTYVSVANNRVDITIYFIRCEIAGTMVSPGEVKSIRYLKDGTFKLAETSYDFFTDVVSIKFSLDNLSEYTTLKMEFNGERTLRLKLDISAKVEATEEPVFRTAERAYLVPVAAWNATSDVASMMNPLVYEYAYVKVNASSVTIVIYFIKGQIMGQTVEPPQITAFKYKNVGRDDYIDAVLTYIETTNVKRVELTLSTTDLSDLEMIASQVTYIITTQTTASLRLKLDFDSAEVTAGEPQFPS
jgi:hypothetical protein